MNVQKRYGLGMNPRRESGTTDALQSGTYRNPINAPPTGVSYFSETKKHALKELIPYYVNRYKLLWRYQQNNKDTEIRRWVNNSRVNYYFGIYMVGTYYGKPLSITDITNQMDITRVTTRKLVADTLSYRWIHSIQDRHDKRVVRYKANKILYKSWEGYIEAILETEKDNILEWEKHFRVYQYCKDMDT